MSFWVYFLKSNRGSSHQILGFKEAFARGKVCLIMEQCLIKVLQHVCSWGAAMALPSFKSCIPEPLCTIFENSDGSQCLFWMCRCWGRACWWSCNPPGFVWDHELSFCLGFHCLCRALGGRVSISQWFTYRKREGNAPTQNCIKRMLRQLLQTGLGKEIYCWL